MVVDKNLFEVKNISFSYNDEEIFSDISFSIKRGMFYVFWGQMELGKLH